MLAGVDGLSDLLLFELPPTSEHSWFEGRQVILTPAG